MKRLLIGLFALPFILGCGVTDSTSPNGSILGTWDLRSINGTMLPFIVSSGTTTTTFSSSVLTISEDGTYSEVTTRTDEDFNSSGTRTITEMGTWTAVNGFITFTDQTDGGLQYTGSVTGNTLTENYLDLTPVYSRR